MRKKVKVKVNTALAKLLIPLSFTSLLGGKMTMIGTPMGAPVLAELEACKAANPGCHVKVTGHDNRRQGQVMSFVVHHPD